MYKLNSCDLIVFNVELQDDLVSGTTVRTVRIEFWIKSTNIDKITRTNQEMHEGPRR
jgi:hypothetical protein